MCMYIYFATMYFIYFNNHLFLSLKIYMQYNCLIFLILFYKTMSSIYLEFKRVLNLISLYRYSL